MAESAAPESAEPELVALGAIARPHGVRGELRVHRFNPDSELLLHVEHVMLGGDVAATRRVVRARLGPKGMVLMLLEGVDGREAAEALRNVELHVPRALLPDLEDEEWYHVDLIGLPVIGPTGETLGTVERIETYPSIECLRVTVAGEVVEIPLLEPWVTQIDLEEGIVSVGDLSDLPRNES